MSGAEGTSGLSVLRAIVHDRTERIRMFVRSKDTTEPVPGVPVKIVAVLLDEETEQEREVPLAFLESDRYGYLSHNAGEIARRDDLVHLWLRPYDNAELQVDAFAVVDAKADPAIVTIPIPGDHIATKYGGPTLPSVPDPDPTDWTVSPSSFATAESIRLGEYGCEELLHSRQSERRFHFVQLIRNDGPPEMLASAATVECERGGDLPDRGHEYQKRCFRRGAMLEYEIEWVPVGHGLGRIVYSLPLAPCESVDIAVIDWQRQDRIVRTEDTSFAEQLRHNQLREREIEEAVESTLSELQKGGSFMAGTAGAGSASWGVFSLGMTGALGGASTGSRGRRRLVANTTQQVADGLSQNTSAMRHLNSTVVVQASQAEGEVIQTRTVTNNNHCHALTLLYYEVLRHYLVTVSLTNWQDVLFVRYKPINDFQRPNSGVSAERFLGTESLSRECFDEDTVFRHKRILRPILLDPSLDCGFDAIRDYLCAEALWERRPPSRPPSDNLVGTIEAVFRTGTQGMQPYHADKEYIKMWLVTKGGDIPLCPQGLREISTHPLAASFIGGFAENGGSRGLFQADQEDVVTLEPADQVRWETITGVKVWTSGDARDWDMTYLRLHTASDDIQWTMLEYATGFTFTDTNPEKTFGAEEGWQTYGPASPQGQLEGGAYCCKEGLLRHLNDNLLYYSRAIWLAQDPEERAQAFERYHLSLPVSENGGERMEGRLIDLIENRIVGVTGDYVAFPLPTTGLSDRIVQDSPTKEHQTVISMPTRGVFAEAKLSYCNACETRDITRYWDWTESPCREPPEIAPIQAGQHESQDLSGVTPSAMPSPVVNIVNPPNAPDPMGLAAAMQVLRTPDIFRNMSAVSELSDLLQKLTEGAVSLAAARTKAGNILGSSGDAPAGSEPRESPQDQHDRRMAVDGAIRDAEEEGALTPPEADRLTAEQRQRMVDEAGRQPPPARPRQPDTPSDDRIAVSVFPEYSDRAPLRGSFFFGASRAGSEDETTWRLAVLTADSRSNSALVQLPRGGCNFTVKATISSDEALRERTVSSTLPGVGPISIPVVRVIPPRSDWVAGPASCTISEDTRDVHINITANLDEYVQTFSFNLGVDVGVEPTIEATWANEVITEIQGKIREFVNAGVETTRQLAGRLGVTLSGTASAGGTITATVTYHYITHLSMAVTTPPE